MRRKLTQEFIESFRAALYEDEKKGSTIEKYVRDVKKLFEYLKSIEISKEDMIRYKQHLKNCGAYKTSSINSFLAAANRFCEIMGCPELKVRRFKVQEGAFLPENKELTPAEYGRLVEAAMEKRDERLAMILQAIASTGIRIGELPYITVESLGAGMTDIYNKGKIRRVLYPGRLQKILTEYVRRRKLSGGPVFCTRSGKPVDRSNIWREMKKLCEAARVDQSKVFPHNLRHLFAVSFYRIKKDIAKLADVLGHSSIETTRLYIKSTGKEHKKQLDMMDLVIVTALPWGGEEMQTAGET